MSAREIDITVKSTASLEDEIKLLSQLTGMELPPRKQGLSLSIQQSPTSTIGSLDRKTQEKSQQKSVNFFQTQLPPIRTSYDITFSKETSVHFPYTTGKVQYPPISSQVLYSPFQNSIFSRQDSRRSDERPLVTFRSPPRQISHNFQPKLSLSTKQMQRHPSLQRFNFSRPNQIAPPLVPIKIYPQIRTSNNVHLYSTLDLQSHQNLSQEQTGESLHLEDDLQNKLNQGIERSRRVIHQNQID